jgi:hypothetical protein
VLEFMLGDRKQDWLDAGLAELYAGDIGAICAAARVFPLAGRKASELGTTLGYFEHGLMVPPQPDRQGQAALPASHLHSCPPR